MTPLEAMTALELDVTAVFVPFSQSRNAHEEHHSLNWRVTLTKSGRAVLTTDYMAGCAHCPSYKQSSYKTVDGNAAVREECETGRAVRWRSESLGLFAHGAPILPNTVDVLYSLVLDADVINYSTFEEWANEFGYDPDSRKAEATYRACLQHALALRGAVGDDGLRTLQEAFQDY